MGEPSVFDFTVTDNRGEEVSLSRYRGNVLLIVNTASACGFTPQYEGLEQLYQGYRGQGFVVLGFPCNQFGGQEPGSDAEIAAFCHTTYGTTFPLHHKIDVNGTRADPLYVHLKHEAPGLLQSEAIKWNFTKFLVGRDGRVRKRFAPQDKPASLKGEIEIALGEETPKVSAASA